MSEEHRMNVDVLDPLGEALAGMIAQMGNTGDLSEYAQGQMDYYKEALEAIDDATSNTHVAHVLEGAASEFGLSFDGNDIAPMPEDKHTLGALTGWTLALGYAEGILKGVEVTLQMSENIPGVSGSLDIR